MTIHAGGGIVTERSHIAATADRDVPSIDTSVAHTSRIYDYLLGGSDNFAVDRELAEHAFSAYPGGLDGARADARHNRAFLGRAVRFLAGEAGLRQFLDIGTGIPGADNTHAVALDVAPESRIVYVDNDPIVLSHAHALLRRNRGRTAYVHGDLREPASIIEQVRGTLDLDQPVGIVLVGILHVLPDDADPHGCVAALVDAVPSGSYVAISHMVETAATEEGDLRVVSARLEASMRDTYPPSIRSADEVRRFFDGLELVEPGLVPPGDWRPDLTTPAPPARPTPILCGVGRKP